MTFIRSLVLLVALPSLVLCQTYRFSFAAWGDPQWGAGFYGATAQGITSDSTESENIVALINAGIGGREASFTLVLGDIVHDFADPGFPVGRMAATKTVLDKLDSAYYVIPGNHDALFDTLSYFLASFTFPPAGTTGSLRGGYYFTKNEWCFIHVPTAIDNSQDVTPVDVDSLSVYLAVEPTKWKVLFSHHPQHGSAELGNESAVRDSVEANGKVKMYLAGHLDAFIGSISNGVEYRRTNSGNEIAGYEILWVDVFNDGSYQIKTLKSTSIP